MASQSTRSIRRPVNRIVVSDGQQDVGGSPAVRDDDRTLGGSALGGTDVVIEFACRDSRRRLLVGLSPTITTAQDSCFLDGQPELAGGIGLSELEIAQNRWTGPKPPWV